MSQISLFTVLLKITKLLFAIEISQSYYNTYFDGYYDLRGGLEESWRSRDERMLLLGTVSGGQWFSSNLKQRHGYGRLSQQLECFRRSLSNTEYTIEPRTSK